MKNFDESYEIKVPVRDPKTGEPLSDEKGEMLSETIVVSRNARVSRDRSFVIGGETFAYRPAVAPESIRRWAQMSGGEFTLKDEQGKPVLDEKGEQISTLSEEETLAIWDETTLAFLEPGQEEKWAKVRDPQAENPLNVADLQALILWLFEEQTGRPTSKPSVSTNGSGTAATGTSSTVASSSPAATG